MINQKQSQPGNLGIAYILALLWVFVVISSHIYFNMSYYTYKISTFVSFIIRLVS